MNKHCPNCHLDVAGDKCRDCGYVFPPVWVCSDCGATFSCVGQFKFCPVCRDKQAVLEKEYWDNKRVGLRSITDDIVAKILAGGN